MKPETLVDFIADLLRQATAKREIFVLWWCLREDLKEKWRKRAQCMISVWVETQEEKRKGVEEDVRYQLPPEVKGAISEETTDD